MVNSQDGLLNGRIHLCPAGWCCRCMALKANEPWVGRRFSYLCITGMDPVRSNEFMD